MKLMEHSFFVVLCSRELKLKLEMTSTEQQLYVRNHAFFETWKVGKNKELVELLTSWLDESKMELIEPSIVLEPVDKQPIIFNAGFFANILSENAEDERKYLESMKRKLKHSGSDGKHTNEVVFNDHVEMVGTDGHVQASPLLTNSLDSQRLSSLEYSPMAKEMEAMDEADESIHSNTKSHQSNTDETVPSDDTDINDLHNQSHIDDDATHRDDGNSNDSNTQSVHDNTASSSSDFLDLITPPNWLTNPFSTA